jgi:16S rRNA pseudouridine516 synthase
MRLDKLLSELGVASRKELRDIIRRGRVRVDGVTVTAPEQKVDAELKAISDLKMKQSEISSKVTQYE